MLIPKIICIVQSDQWEATEDHCNSRDVCQKLSASKQKWQYRWLQM